MAPWERHSPNLAHPVPAAGQAMEAPPSLVPGGTVSVAEWVGDEPGAATMDEEMAWMPTGQFVDEPFDPALEMASATDEDRGFADDAIEIVPPIVDAPAPADLAAPVAPPLRQARLAHSGGLPAFADSIDEDERSVLNREDADSLARPLQGTTRNELRRASTPGRALQDQEVLPAPGQDPEAQLPGDFDLPAPGRSCDAFRERLLGQRIEEIALDISPPKSLARTTGSLIRDWTDRTGEGLGRGTLVDMRRGYLIVDSEAGQQKIPVSRLGDADLAAVADYWSIPVQCTIGYSSYEPRNWVPQTMTWKASGLCHKPLYFENVQLERYGHTHGPFTEPIHSTVHFFSSLIVWPYHSAIHPPNECQYALGYYRPGSCAPWLKDPMPLSLRGSLRQAIVIAGFAGLP